MWNRGDQSELQIVYKFNVYNFGMIFKKLLVNNNNFQYLLISSFQKSPRPGGPSGKASTCNQQVTAVGSTSARGRASPLVWERFHLTGRPDSGPWHA